ncbi:hypothetical protein D3C71_1635240 [compost metagenome]
MPAMPLLLAVYDGTRTPPWKDSIEAMLMILPLPWAMKCLPAACEMKNADLMLTFITSSQSCSLNSTASARRIRPALLTRISRPPRPSMVSRMTRSTGSMLIRFASIARQRRPSAVILAMVSVGGAMPATATSAPACANATAMPWPRPVLPPVTRATLPSRLNGLAIAYVVLVQCVTDAAGAMPAARRGHLSWQMSSTCMSV